MSLTSDKIEIVLSSNTEITHSTSHLMEDILQLQTQTLGVIFSSDATCSIYLVKYSQTPECFSTDKF